ncbi:RNA polymerase II subunit A C-terminal domain phosphatase SSU72-like [Myzus persicae]|uniref:RNA polymerase II subunit A C-terminal domain phosphatase SSU72-like n=1 Tax=Myzus persicae TaxID=13164 RepID=UPI000B937815|nr:RNA polymerase II subunit A C-terminal domain phosphatase SSU72-like [Myzus persicae]XP_022168975.1 RNA polymerase II subunit A C-terminal domain phosphatase SSU72-like [Myzus persicae]XP_022168976.1 RNA polymerase II subunit A C-terminal domain phosphatase SSU72-like [Myzus persicae]
MAISDFTVAVVCSSNMNRSMEAHAFLRKKGFNVRSFGTGDKVKLPGTAWNKPNIYDFGCSYDDIYRDLYNKNQTFYTRNGLLNMLDRNRRIKQHPERFQQCNEQFTVVITCEERVYNQVLEHFETIQNIGNKPVYVININIQDNQEEATFGSFLIYEFVNLLSRSEDLDNAIEQLVIKYQEKCHKSLLNCVFFF